MGLTNGDQFYFSGMECLLTIVIRQNGIVPSLVSRDALELPLQQASVKEEEQDVEILPGRRDPADDCGTSEARRSFLSNDPSTCANSSKTIAALQCHGMAGSQSFLGTSRPSSKPAVNCQLLEKPSDGSHKNDQEDSDSLGLDAYDCAALRVPRFDVIRSFSREELPNPAVAIENVNSAEMNESRQICAENKEALTNSTVVDKALENGKCSHFSIDAEGCRLPNYRPEYLLSEACTPHEQIEEREAEEYNPILSSETVDVRFIKDELLPSDPLRSLVTGNIRGYLSSYPNLDVGQTDNATLSRSPVSGIRDECPERMEEKEHPEVSGGANGREDDHVISADVEDESWPDGPVEGMEPVIVSVSGYEGVDKQNLVKLINKTGAAFTGVLSKANTHLVFLFLIRRTWLLSTMRVSIQ